MRSEAAARADFSAIRYAQVLGGRRRPARGARRAAGRRLPVDRLGRRQRAGAADAQTVARHRAGPEPGAARLPRAARRRLSRAAHPELLELIGSRPSARREQLVRALPAALSPRPRAILGRARRRRRGRHRRRRQVRALLRAVPHARAAAGPLAAPTSLRCCAGAIAEERRAFYDEQWDTWRWRLLFRVFFSRFVMGRLGRDPSSSATSRATSPSASWRAPGTR